MQENRAVRWLALFRIEDDDNAADQELQKLPIDIPHHEKAQIKVDTERLAARIPIFSESVLRETLQWLLACFCCEKGIRYDEGLIDVLAPFFLVGFHNVATTYTCFREFFGLFFEGLFAE